MDLIELSAQGGDAAAGEAPKRTGALSAMRLSELQQVANELGISGTAKMRKSDLLTAIRERRSGGSAASTQSAPTQRDTTDERGATSEQGGTRRTRRAGAPAGAPTSGGQQTSDQTSRPAAQQDSGSGPADRAGAEQAVEEALARRAQQAHQDEPGSARTDSADRTERGDRSDRSNRDRSGRGERSGENGDQSRSRDNDRDGSRDSQNAGQRNRQQGQQRDGQQRDGQQGQQRDGQQGQQRDRQNRDGNRDNQRDNQQRDNQQRDRQRDNNRDNRDNQRDDEPGGRRRNRNRNRDRKRRGRGEDYQGLQGQEVETYTEDDVLVPVAGIVDLHDNYAFVRTSGYLPGPNDVYVPLGMVKKLGLRKGDAVQGAVKANRDDQGGQQSGNRAKFNALVRVDAVNGKDPEEARNRAEFNSLTPLYPQERLRLENPQNNLTTRIIDLVAPIGKGQRGLLVSPPKAGKTMMLQAIANAITTNNPEVHLMVVLVDERPEEVTDMQRTVRGEVIASTFDRPAGDHTTVAELAIERAKRLVELGHDVVVLLDGITRLGRAYNLAAPASGRILSGGVDSAALYPPKKFFGAARNIEHGGSLTILATALVETGSKMDEVIFEEFKGTGNMELKLSRELSNRRIYPAVDVNASGTRREDILMSAEELKIMWKLRRVLAALDNQQGLELLLDRIKKTSTNMEFLMQVQKTTPGALGSDD
ncbi:transcription termination factor Rho [Arsenicicoccus piscis]|uniref:Transcription termination factor Rho n=1 Tax=Arsenicicoccus piscis TaxID=673954 RepID=A0ABQ6HPH9_9MICO|nr:transcription termination factor Rho [Arsenicicoccus piscis]MCH8629135.1 transcription termination factor Rho [Arsenicicoccus piscis]GMA20301.1 hypothetical protein GCM10025862_23220 [Arsenicicoccus piscis]